MAMNASDTGESTPVARVLVADDDELSRNIVAMILEGMGCRVDVVADGAEAVEAASEGLYDLILLDGTMPRLSGIEAARAIRQMDGDRGRVPIVGITGNPLQITEEKCLQAGMSQYLQKPLGREAYRQIVEHWVLRPMVAASNSDSNAGTVPRTGILEQKAARRTSGNDQTQE